MPQLADKTNEVVWEGKRWGMDDVTGWVANTKSGKDAYNLWKFASENTIVEFDFMQFSDGSFSVTTSEDVSTTLTGTDLPENRNKIVTKWFHSHPGDDEKVLNISGPDKVRRNSYISEEKGNLNAEIKIYAPHFSDNKERWVDFRYAE